MPIVSHVRSSELRSLATRLDPEYFLPARIQASGILESYPHKTLLGTMCSTITQGPNPKFAETGVACLNGKNIYFGSASTGEPNYVPPGEFARFKNYVLQGGDIVITLKHATKIGRAWIIDHGPQKIFSRNVGLIRLREGTPVSAASLLFFLWSDVGQRVLDRFSTGGTTGQITLAISYLRRLWVPIFPERRQRELDSYLQRYSQLQNKGELLYTSAEETLLNSLGIRQVDLPHPLAYNASLTQISKARRWDAEHFRPKYEVLLDAIRRAPSWRSLGQMATFNFRGLQPQYVDDGTVAVVTSQHLGPHHLAYGHLERTSEEAYTTASRARVRRGDVLVYTTGAYVGRTNVFLSDIKALASNHVNIIRLKPEYDPAYVALFLNSFPGLLQTEKHAAGSAQAELYPSGLAKFIIPLLQTETMQQIGDRVRKSYQIMTEAKGLLENARRTVEELVEKGARP